MFPEREVVLPKPTVIDPNNLPENLKGGSDEILAKHGGKIALVGFSLAAFLIFRYFKSSSDKEAVVEGLHGQSPLEPYEANQIRLSNDVSRDDFKLLIRSFETELKAKEEVRNIVNLTVMIAETLPYVFINSYFHQMTYENFVSKVQSVIKKKTAAGHLLDRVMYKYFESANSESSRRRDNSCPVDLALTVFNLTMHSPPSDRIEMLFQIGCELDSLDDAQIDGEKEISVDSTRRVVDNLLQSWQVVAKDCTKLSKCSRLTYLVCYSRFQVPNDVRVVEIEDDYIPFRKFRVKRSDEMVRNIMLK